MQLVLEWEVGLGCGSRFVGGSRVLVGRNVVGASRALWGWGGAAVDSEGWSMSRSWTDEKM